MINNEKIKKIGVLRGYILHRFLDEIGDDGSNTDFSEENIRETSIIIADEVTSLWCNLGLFNYKLWLFFQTTNKVKFVQAACDSYDSFYTYLVELLKCK